MNFGIRTIAILLASALALPIAAVGGEASTPSLTGTLVDAADGNRFFTRVGGTAEDRLTYDGLEANKSYTLESQLVVVGSGEQSEPVITEFTTTGSSGDLVVEFPVAPNETDFNIDYVSEHNLYEMNNGTPTIVLSVIGDSSDPTRTIQVHSIQRIEITSVYDAEDGDRKIDGQGGEIIAELHYENMVEGYAYTVWGQLLTPSGQAIGVFASIARYAPVGKNGDLKLTFTVPSGYEGLSLTPSVGIYHFNRVTLAESGYLNWNEGAPNPVMIASDVDLDKKKMAIEVGTPFGKKPKKPKKPQVQEK